MSPRDAQVPTAKVELRGDHGQPTPVRENGAMTSYGEGSDQPWNPRRGRSGNERLLLDRLRTDGPASRAQLARDTGLSKPTVSSALASLELAGLARQAGTHSPERGRSAVLYAPDPTAGYALGIDIGRSWLRVALADLDGTIVAGSEARNSARSSGALVELVVGTARHLVDTSGIEPHKLAHAVVGTPGVYDSVSRRVRFAQQLPGWDRAGLFDDIRAGLGVPLEIHNDANLAALGEYTHGVGAGSRLFVYVMVGTGLGMGVVSEGRLFTGAHGGAGEIGFLPWPHASPAGSPAPPSAPDIAAAPGQMEAMVSGHAVVTTARSLGMNHPADAKEVFDAAREGDAAAARAVEEEARRLAYTVAVVASVLDPDLLVLGGGIGHSADLLLAPVHEHLRALTPLRVRLAAGALGDGAVLHGAVATALEAARDLTFDRKRPGG